MTDEGWDLLTDEQKKYLQSEQIQRLRPSARVAAARELMTQRKAELTQQQIEQQYPAEENPFAPEKLAEMREQSEVVQREFERRRRWEGW